MHTNISPYIRGQERADGNVSNRKSASVPGLGGSHSTAHGPYKDVFPCNEPVNPKFRDFGERLKTFFSWQYSHILNPQHLAAAGLFYLGDGDRCKCYYCNGGLRYWERGDDAMVEHAKYFPECEFVLQHKGPEFVAELNAKFPNIKRPGVANAHNQANAIPRNVVQSNESNAALQHQPQLSMDIPPQRTPTTTSHSNDNNELIEEAKKFGFDENSIKLLINRKRANNESAYSGLGDLISDLINLEEEGNHMETDMDTLTPHCNEIYRPPLNRPTVVSDHATSQYDHHTHISMRTSPARLQAVAADSPLKTQLQTALDESMCRSCFSRERSCAFMSCGHLCCCFECGQKMERCPICNTKILQAIKIYKT